MKMSESIKIELGEPEVTIDYSALAERLMEYATDTMNEIANEAIEHYVRYEMDVSDIVSDMVSDQVNDSIDSLLGDVSPGSLCGLGSSFNDAVRTLLVHHIDLQQVLIENYEIEKNGGITKMVQDAMKKEMVVNISFVDKQPAEVVTVIEQESVAKDLLPGPVDEINTRSENV
jgi:hypothetical protein